MKRETETPKLWRDMSDEEKSNVPDEVLNDPTNPLQIPWGEWTRGAKGAVLLAQHEGEEIEAIYPDDPSDYWSPHDNFSNYYAYRVKLAFQDDDRTLKVFIEGEKK